MNKKRTLTIISIIAMVLIVFAVFRFSDNKELQKEVVEKVTDTVTKMATYEMTEEEIKELPSTEIIEQTEEQEKQAGETQATTETEGFEEQGEIAFNGDNEFPQVAVGNYSALTYYSQLDQKWRYHPYTSVNNPNQNIGSSGCRTNFCSNDSNKYKRCNNP